MLIRHREYHLCEYINKNCSLEMKHFDNFINELQNGKIKTEPKMEKIYRKYYFLDEYIDKYKEKILSELYYEITSEITKINNSANLIQHLLKINDYFKEKKEYVIGSHKHEIFESFLSDAYFLINDDTILIEDRFLIKDITKVYTKNVKSTLDELKKYIS